MGWNVSMIIIQNPQNFQDEKLLLDKIGGADYEFEEEATFGECLNPSDSSLNIGYWNQALIICDDYRFTFDFLSVELSEVEQALIKLFPDSEILSIACSSMTNYHSYALIKNGIKIRYKCLDAEIPLTNFGELLPEEEGIYTLSKEINGQKVWIENGMEFNEDQMMEVFTFGMAKRLLTVNLASVEGEQCLKTTFKKYLASL